MNSVQWYMLMVPVFRRYRKKDGKFKAIFDYRLSVRPAWIILDETISLKKLLVIVEVLFRRLRFGGLMGAAPCPIEKN